MDIALIGIDDEGAELSERERFAQEVGRRALPSVVLSTCQRTELYFPSERLDELKETLCSLPLPLYVKEGRECFVHLASVTAGLKSALVGESDIQRQVKGAYAAACCLPSSLHFLFQKSLKVAKGVRTRFLAPSAAPTLERIVYEWVESHCGFVAEEPLLFIGNSVTNRKMITYFMQQGASNLTLCTRSMGAALEFCRARGVALMPREALRGGFRAVVAATQADRPISFDGGVACVCDLSVPRCVDRSLEAPLLDMDAVVTDLRSRTAFNEESFERASLFVREAVEKQIGIYHSKKKRVVVCA